jgi:ABC-type sugar transport system substrate-binding protein
VHKITVRALTVLAAVALAVGLAPGVAQAQPIQVVIGPVTQRRLV